MEEYKDYINKKSQPFFQPTLPRRKQTDQDFVVNAVSQGQPVEHFSAEGTHLHGVSVAHSQGQTTILIYLLKLHFLAELHPVTNQGLTPESAKNEQLRKVNMS